MVEELDRKRKHLFKSFLKKGDITEFNILYRRALNRYLMESIRRYQHKISPLSSTPFALVALGGYGRSELCAYSDIDLLVLFERDIPDEVLDFIKWVIFPLWNIGLDVAHSVRTIQDCLILSKKDFWEFTSLLDSSFIYGDVSLYLQLRERFFSEVVFKERDRFRRWVGNIYEDRIRSYGDSTYLLEPDIKNGIGGLRDCHNIRWLFKVFEDYLPLNMPISSKDYMEFNKRLRFIQTVRNYLHLVSKRKNERLSFEYQIEIARYMGFKDEDNRQGVEQFLENLHKSITFFRDLLREILFNLCRSPIGALGEEKEIGEFVIKRGEIDFKDPAQIIEKPSLMIRIFQLSSRLHIPVSHDAKRIIKDISSMLRRKIEDDRDSMEAFLDIIVSKDGIEILNEIYDTPLLDILIPEFGHIRYLIQFDSYHIYPVGRHLLMTYSSLKKPKNTEDILISTILSEIEDPLVLYLSALFHDLGKRRGNHTFWGVKIAENILNRFKLDESRIEEILFLIENHLLLIETATRRDIGDEKVIIQCAKKIRSIERLKMLYLLTWADSVSTGPRAWNPWVEALVKELFIKILHILERGELVSEKVERRLRLVRKRVEERLSDIVDKDHISGYFDMMSRRYLLNTPPSMISHHILAAKRLIHKLATDPDSFLLEPQFSEYERCWIVHFLAKDRPGLFSDIAGALALNNINILSAHIYTWYNGIAVDIFYVSNPLDTIHPERIWEKVQEDIRSILKGEISLRALLDKKRRPFGVGIRLTKRRHPEVYVDNESSDFFTLLEIHADDRIGLLYNITRKIYELGLDIRVAKIATKVDQVVDVFYIRDRIGQKLEPSRVNEIKDALINELLK